MAFISNLFNLDFSGVTVLDSVDSCGWRGKKAVFSRLMEKMQNNLEQSLNQEEASGRETPPEPGSGSGTSTTLLNEQL